LLLLAAAVDAADADVDAVADDDGDDDGDDADDAPLNRAIWAFNLS
jgi:hypothetical protein